MNVWPLWYTSNLSASATSAIYNLMRIFIWPRPQCTRCHILYYRKLSTLEIVLKRFKRINIKKKKKMHSGACSLPWWVFLSLFANITVVDVSSLFAFTSATLFDMMELAFRQNLTIGDIKMGHSRIA